MVLMSDGCPFVFLPYQVLIIFCMFVFCSYNARGEVLYAPNEVALPYSHPMLTKLAQVRGYTHLVSLLRTETVFYITH